MVVHPINLLGQRTAQAHLGRCIKETMHCHDAGKKQVHLTLTVPRDKFEPIPGLDHKVMATVDCPHFASLARVSHPDFLATSTGHVTGAIIDHVEGLPTGASLGAIIGHSTPDGFVPMPTDDTVAHVDARGDTHVFHSVMSGRTPKGTTQKIVFKKPDEHANPEQIKAKVERWSDVEPHDVEMKVFAAKNSGGKQKSLATIPTASPLGRLIKNNASNAKFKQSTGEIRTITDNDSEHYVLGESEGRKLRDGLKEALATQSVWAENPLSVRLITDTNTLTNTGNHPFNLSATIERDNAEIVTRGDMDGAAAPLTVTTTGGDVDDVSDSLARAVFADEADVVSISEVNGGEPGGSD